MVHNSTHNPPGNNRSYQTFVLFYFIGLTYDLWRTSISLYERYVENSIFTFLHLKCKSFCYGLLFVQYCVFRMCISLQLVPWSISHYNLCHVVCVHVWGACVQSNILARRQSVAHGRALCQSTTMSVYPSWGKMETILSKTGLLKIAVIMRP